MFGCCRGNSYSDYTLNSVSYALNITLVQRPSSHHEGVDHRPQYGLQQQQHGAHRTLVGDDAVAVADGGLGLNGEEESRDEAVDVVDAGGPRTVLQMVQITSRGKETETEEV